MNNRFVSVWQADSPAPSCLSTVVKSVPCLSVHQKGNLLPPFVQAGCQLKTSNGFRLQCHNALKRCNLNLCVLLRQHIAALEVQTFFFKTTKTSLNGINERQPWEFKISDLNNRGKKVQFDLESGKEPYLMSVKDELHSLWNDHCV